MNQTDWDERYADKDFVWDVAPNVFVEQHLAERAAGAAIDLAAGECRNAVWLARRGWRVQAVDYSSVGLEKGARLAAKHDVTAAIDFVAADVLTYQPDDSVDLVLLAYLQLPADERRAVLEHAATWLAPGGSIFVVAHDRTNAEHGYGGPPSDEVCYDVAETVAWLRGLRIDRAEVARRAVETDDGARTALDTLIIATRPD